MHTQTKETQAALNPTDAFTMLKEGNQRFMKNIKSDRNLQSQISETSEGQYPFAALLSCIDSRVPPEHIFDQGIGDIFSVRVAGNVVNEDVLGSLEYSCKVAGSKIVLVLGHTRCGAVTAACKKVELGNITPLLSKIKPAIDAVPVDGEYNLHEIEMVSQQNVMHAIHRIRTESSILSEMENNNEVKIIGGIYNVSNGQVEFLQESNNNAVLENTTKHNI